MKSTRSNEASLIVTQGSLEPIICSTGRVLSLTITITIPTSHHGSGPIEVQRSLPLQTKMNSLTVEATSVNVEVD